MPKGSPLPAYEVQEMVARFNQYKKQGKPTMEACKLIGEHLDREPSTVWAVIRRLTPTTGIAVDYLKAQAYRLAHRVVSHGSVEQALDVLSRPNIGVLEPIKKGDAGGGGFYLSVESNSCGAVRVGVALPGNNPVQGVVHAQEHDSPQLTEGDSFSPESLHEISANPGNGRSFSFGRATQRKTTAGLLGKGNGFQRGAKRRPRGSAGVPEGQEGAPGHVAEEKQGVTGHGSGFLDLKNYKA